MNLTSKQKRSLWAKWRDDPVRFLRDVVRLRLWKKQAEIARAIAKHSRVAVRSGHKIGKSKVAAGIAIWWLHTRENALVIMTSASYRQVKGILWKEFRQLYVGDPTDPEKRPIIPLGGDVAINPETGLTLPDGRQVIGLSTREPEKMAGFSSYNLLYILDEASGIAEEIFEAIEGNRASGGRVLMMSNATKTSGTFFDAFHSSREYWFCIHVSSEETPNATGEDEPVPGLATKEWIEEKRKEWGIDSLLYQVRVKGNFPAQSTSAVISLAVLEAALQRFKDDEDEDRDPNEPRVDNSGRLELGVDPAREGDDEFVVYARRSRKGLGARAFHGLDGPKGAAKVLEVVRDLRRPGEIPVVKLDIIGVGAAVYDALKESKEVEVIPINVASSADPLAPGEPEFALLRDQIWFRASGWLETAAIPEDSQLEAELVAPEHRIDAKGRVRVDDKPTIKKKLKPHRSPDRADALCLAVYNPPPAFVPVWNPTFGASRHA